MGAGIGSVAPEVQILDLDRFPAVRAHAAGGWQRRPPAAVPTATLWRMPWINTFNHGALLVIGCCGHWWHADSETDALASNCPEDQRPPSHVLAPAGNGWRQASPADGCAGPVPRDVACPHCGGYVRGHQWIGAEVCSIVAVFAEPVTREVIDARAGTLAAPLAVPPPTHPRGTRGTGAGPN